MPEADDNAIVLGRAGYDRLAYLLEGNDDLRAICLPFYYLCPLR